MSTLKSPGIVINERAEEFQPTGSISMNPTVVIGEFDNGEAFVPRTVNLKGLKQFYNSSNSFAYLTAKKILEEDETVTVVRVTENDATSVQNLNAIKFILIDNSNAEFKFMLGVGGKLAGLAIDFAKSSGVTLLEDILTIKLVDRDNVALYEKEFSLTSTDDNYILNMDRDYGNNDLFLLYADELSGDAPYTLLASEDDSPTSVIYKFTSISKQAETPMIISNESVPSNLFKIKTRSVGSNLNKKYKIEISNLNTSDKTFDLHVRDFDDTYKYKQKLESFYNLNLDPNSSNYICKVIGDEYSEIGTDGFLSTKGDFANNSNYIYIVPENKLKNGDFIGLLPIGFGSMKNVFLGANIVDFNISVINSGSSNEDNGFDFENNSQMLMPFNDKVADEGSIGFGDGDGSNYFKVSFATDSVEPTDGFLLPLYGGYDGSLKIKEYNNLSTTNICGFDFDGDNEDDTGYKAFDTALKILANFDQYDFEKIVLNLPYTYCSTLIKRAISFCKVERKTTSIVVFDVDEKDNAFTKSTAKDLADDLDTTYAFTAFTNWIKINDEGKTRFVPESCLLPKIMSQSDNIGSLWSAPAFVNRGRILDAISVGKISSNDDRDFLYENGINPIKIVRDFGITLYGHRAPTRRDVVTKEIQIRRTSNYIKRFFVSQTELILGEANTDENKSLFRGRIEPFLNNIVSNGGLERYELSFGANTPQNRNTLFVELYLFFPSAINFVQLNINVSTSTTTVEEV